MCIIYCYQKNFNLHFTKKNGFDKLEHVSIKYEQLATPECANKSYVTNFENNCTSKAFSKERFE